MSRNFLVYPDRLRSRVGCTWCEDRTSLLDLISSLPKSSGAKNTMSGYSWALVDVGAATTRARKQFFAASVSG
jgi:hypothetical protein